MTRTARRPSILGSDNKEHIVTVKVQTDLYEWLVAEARGRRTTLSYIIREALDTIKTAKENG
jgi:hypothetical protein